jgi:pimeloyl-ACP methyl ester carboxylesterase
MVIERPFDTGQVVLNIAEGPTHGTPLLLLHGTTQDCQLFSEWLPTLEQDWHVYALDFRGHGKSGWVPAAYQINDYVQDVVQVINQVIGQPVVAMGFSLGGTVTLGVAAHLPQQVRAIVCLDPGLMMRDNAILRSTPGPHQWVYDFFDWLSANVPSARSEEELTERCKARNPALDDAAARSQARRLRCLDPDMIADLYTNHDSFNFIQALEGICCPALLVRGDPALGGVVRDSDAELFQALVPQSSVVQIPNVGHGIIWDQAGVQTFDHVLKFLESL